MFLTIAVQIFLQVFANQIMHLFYMQYAYVFIVLIVFVTPLTISLSLSLSLVRFLH